MGRRSVAMADRIPGTSGTADMSRVPEWIQGGSGESPHIVWSVRTEGDIVASALARESGQVFLADESGSVYAIGRSGEIQAVSRGFRDADRLAWCDSGAAGVVVTEGEQVSRLNPRLEPVWSASLPGEVLAVAMDPFGNHLAISLATRKTFIMNWRNKRVAEFETMRPLSFLAFVGTRPQLVGAANHGQMCCHSMSGEELWSERVLSNVGDLRCTGDGRQILVAGFNHGVQVYDGEGQHRGAYMLEGTPKLADCSYEPGHVLAATIERHLYWLDADGELKWATETDDDIVAIHCDPVRPAGCVGTKSGWLFRLAWDIA